MDSSAANFISASKVQDSLALCNREQHEEPLKIVDILKFQSSSVRIKAFLGFLGFNRLNVVPLLSGGRSLGKCLLIFDAFWMYPSTRLIPMVKILGPGAAKTIKKLVIYWEGKLSCALTVYGSALLGRFYTFSPYAISKERKR